jgi:hypothetical protein
MGKYDVSKKLNKRNSKKMKEDSAPSGSGKIKLKIQKSELSKKDEKKDVLNDSRY